MTSPPPLSPKHVALLRWIAEGCPAGKWPDHRHKQYMRGLELRGLAIRHKGKGWNASPTPTGLFYLAHDSYPPSLPASRTGPGSPKPTTAAGLAEPIPPQQATRPLPPARGTGLEFEAAETRLLRTKIRNPHPAVRELLDNPKRIDLAPHQRRRVHLITHSLVEETRARGWKIETILRSTRPAYPGGEQHSWPTNDLLRIDAGAQPVGLQFRTKNVRIDHIETAEDRRWRERGLYRYAPRYDYLPSETLRLFLYIGTQSIASWEDTKRVALEDRLAGVLERIAEATRSVLARREAQRLQALEERRRQELEHRQSQRVLHFDTWRAVLLELPDRMRQHDELQRVTASLNEHPRTARVESFLEWAESYINAVDPLGHLPDGEPPDMDYSEWSDWKHYFDQRKRGNWSIQPPPESRGSTGTIERAGPPNELGPG